MHPGTSTAGRRVRTPQRAAAPGPASVRVTGLDVARGLLLITSVTTSAWVGERPAWLQHTDFGPFTYYDTIFPTFVALSGIGLGFAYRKRVSARTTWRRFTILFAAGLIYNGLKADGVNLSNWVITSPLSIYAFLILFIHVLSRWLGSARAWAGFTMGLAVAWSVALRFMAAACPGGVMTPECNPSWPVDHGLMGVHMQYNGAAGYDPVGFVALVGALLNVSIGVTMAHITAETMQRPRALWARNGLWAAAVIGMGLLLEGVTPSSKAMWSPPYALLAGSIGLILFVLALGLFDILKAPAALATPFVALGRNSLLVYFGSHLLMALLLRSPASGGEGSMATALAERVDVVGNPLASLVLFMLASWWGLALILHALRVYIRA